jgi:hypothetical protein
MTRTTWAERVMARAQEDHDHVESLFDPNVHVSPGELAEVILRLDRDIEAMLLLLAAARRRRPATPVDVGTARSAPPVGLEEALIRAAGLIETSPAGAPVDVLAALARAITGRSRLPLVGGGPEPRLFRAAVEAVARSARLRFEPLLVERAVRVWSESVSVFVLVDTLRAAAGSAVGA